MPDISMCVTKNCPLAKDCYRSMESGTKPSEWQSWMSFTWGLDAKRRPACAHYLPTRRRTDGKEKPT